MRGLPWTEPELTRLRMLREVQKLRWVDCAKALPGRNANGCFQAYYKVRKRPAMLAAKQAARKILPQPIRLATFTELLAVKPEIAPIAPALIEKTVLDMAELNCRIAERGLTAGIFGDPPPGRSALDQKRAREGSS